MEDYIILKDYNESWFEIFFFDHCLTNGEIEKINNLIQHIKDTTEDYSNEDIEEQLSETIPYTNSIVICNTHEDNHTMYF